MAKNLKIFKIGKIRKYEETAYFEKKTLSFKEASLPKCDGAKNAGGSRPSRVTVAQACGMN